MLQVLIDGGCSTLQLVALTYNVYVAGPDSWWVYYPAASGTHQSPIDIDPEIADFDTDLATYPLKISYADSSTKYLKNIGTGLKIEVDGSKSCMYLSGYLYWIVYPQSTCWTSQLYTVNQQGWTLSILGWTLSVLRCILNLLYWTFSIQDWILSIFGWTLNVLGWTLSILCWILSILGWTLSVLCCILNLRIKPWVYWVEYSMYWVEHSVYWVEHSVYWVDHSAF